MLFPLVGTCALRPFFPSLNRRFVLAFLLMAFAKPGAALPRPAPTVTILQLSDVRQGQAGAFAIEILPEDESRPVVLRLGRDMGMGRAVFFDGSTQMLLPRSARVQVFGVTSNDVPGSLALTAWLEGAAAPAATAFFDVLPPTLKPRIFFEGRDVTGARQSVALGQAIRLSVFLHPGLPVESEEWIMGKPGEYTGGFLHTSLH